LTSLAPKCCGFLDQSGFGAVARHYLGPVLRDIHELAFENFGNIRVQRPTRFTQKRAISGVLNQGMLE
jgi:hypothetical protein